MSPILPYVPIFVILGICCGMLGIVAWVVTTWLRIKNGYPLENGWGQAVYPKSGDATMERVKLLTQENAQLQAELGAVKDRLATVERIVTDRSYSLDHEIEQLRGSAN
jgi:hypothetical protein